MWGTLNPFPFFTGGSQPAPAQRYILTLNGVNSYIDTGAMNYSSGNNIRFSASLPSNQSSSPCVFGSADNSLLVSCTSTGKIELTGFTGTVNGSPITSGSTDWPSGVAEFNLTATSSGGVLRLGARSDVLSGFFGGYLYNYEDSLGNNYPVDDNSTTVIRNTANPLGAELWDKAPQEYAPSTSQYQFFDQSSDVLAPEYAVGNYILVEADIDVIAGQAQILVGNTGRALNAVGNHKLQFMKEMDVTKQIVLRSLVTGSAIRVNSMSAKRAINWAIPVNVTPSMWSLINV